MAFGAIMPSPERVYVWGYKTDRYKAAMPAVTKYCRRTMIPFLQDGLKVQTAVCAVHPTNTASRTWLASLGFRPEATPSGIGTGDDELIVYVRRPDA